MNSWEHFIATGQLDSDVRAVVGESWIRCREKGKNPDEGVSIVVADGAELEDIFLKNSELLETARPFMDILCSSIDDRDFVVVLTNRDGYILESFGSKEMLHSAFGRHYMRGVQLTEEHNGTSAIGLALLGLGPVQVVGTEHYCVQYHVWGCSAAPLTDEDGSIIGILSITVRRERVHPHTLGLVVSAAAAIKNMLLAQRAQAELKKNSRLRTLILDSLFDGLMMLDRSGSVTYINPSAAKMIYVNPKEAMGKKMSDLVPFKPVAMQALHSGEGYTDKEIVVETARGSQRFSQTAILLRDEEGAIEGVVDIFRELKQVQKMVNQMVGATAQFTFDDLVGETPQVKECIRLGRIAANCNSNTLIEGESGTGKELIAQAIHNASTRASGPFVAINCGALPRDLIESELFGYEEGAFTGARKGGRPGKFEMAFGGTVFLDEIGEMPLDMQVKFLRVLQDRKVMRIGGQQYVDIDVRIIAATNKDLAEDVNLGNFRLDLYYRLNVLQIKVPPLRSRQMDILVLADYFLKKLCARSGFAQKTFSLGAKKLLTNFHWPGNIRELENVIERAVNLCTDELIDIIHLPAHMMLASSENNVSQTGNSLRDMEIEAIQKALDSCGGNMSLTAKTLGIARTTLYQKVKQFGIHN